MRLLQPAMSWAATHSKAPGQAAAAGHKGPTGMVGKGSSPSQARPPEAALQTGAVLHSRACTILLQPHEALQPVGLLWDQDPPRLQGGMPPLPSQGALPATSGPAAEVPRHQLGENCCTIFTSQAPATGTKPHHRNISTRHPQSHTARPATPRASPGPPGRPLQTALRWARDSQRRFSGIPHRFCSCSGNKLWRKQGNQ